MNFQWSELRWVKVYPVEKREMYAEAKRGAFSKLSFMYCNLNDRPTRSGQVLKSKFLAAKVISQGPTPVSLVAELSIVSPEQGKAIKN